MSWDDLRVLLAVAESGSLSQAAEQLGLTQPTVGRRLDRLEAELGFALVRRSSLGCTLSEPAQAMLPELARMREAAEGVSLVSRSAKNDLSGVVRLAMGPLPAHSLLGKLAPALREAPELKLEVLAGTELVRLERGDADLAIRAVVPAGDHWVLRSLGVRRFCVYGARSLLEREPELRGAWEKARWVGWPSGSGTRSARWLRRTLGRDADLRLSHSLLILEAVKAGLGLGVLPAYVAAGHPDLVALGPPLEDLMLESWLVIHPSARRLPRVRWLASKLVELMPDEPSPGAAPPGDTQMRS